MFAINNEILFQKYEKYVLRVHVNDLILSWSYSFISFSYILSYHFISFINRQQVVEEYRDEITFLQQVFHKLQYWECIFLTKNISSLCSSATTSEVVKNTQILLKSSCDWLKANNVVFNLNKIDFLQFLPRLILI